MILVLLVLSVDNGWLQEVILVSDWLLPGITSCYHQSSAYQPLPTDKCHVLPAALTVEPQSLLH